MAEVQTVTGPVDSRSLGRVLAHEHVVTRSPGLREDWPSTYPRDEVLDICIQELSDLRSAGIDTLVDHTTYDLGRDLELLRDASAASGLRVIGATGVWIEPQRFWQLRAPVDGAELLIKDLREGVGDSGIRPGIIKCAIDAAGLTPAVERVLRACAIAHRETGAHISTHTIARNRHGLEQQRIFDEEGVDLSRVQIGHCGDTDDLDYLRAVLQRGSYIGMDRFGVEDLLSDSARMSVVATLCREGHADRLLLSQDASCWNDRMPMAEVRKQRPHWHHRRIVDDIVPGLVELGVTEGQIEQMLVHNPAALFARQDPYPGTPSAAATRHAWD
jgi:phosphotriesterase-related protein